MMDLFLPIEAKKSLEECRELSNKYHKIEEKIKEISIDDQQRLRELDFLKHEISEIENANLIEGEEAVITSVDGSFEPYVVHYAETFIVPECVGEYEITPCGRSENKQIAVIKATVQV